MESLLSFPRKESSFHDFSPEIYQDTTRLYLKPSLSIASFKEVDDEAFVTGRVVFNNVGIASGVLWMVLPTGPYLPEHLAKVNTAAGEGLMALGIASFLRPSVFYASLDVQGHRDRTLPALTQRGDGRSLTVFHQTTGTDADLAAAGSGLGGGSGTAIAVGDILTFHIHYRVY